MRRKIFAEDAIREGGRIEVKSDISRGQEK